MHQSQRVEAYGMRGYRTLSLPPADAEILPGVPWGAYEIFFTPAFWATRSWLDEEEGRFLSYRLGESLAEEVAACLLGGHGIPANVGVAAFRRLQSAGALKAPVSFEEVGRLLASPLLVNGRAVRYRFASIKARFVAASLNEIEASEGLPADDLPFRDWLLRLPGVGLKTASWITRNWRGSDQVAILDVHICRACIAARIFPESCSPSRSYLELERRFLAFATAIGTRPSVLDNVIWQTMRTMGQLLNSVR